MLSVLFKPLLTCVNQLNQRNLRSISNSIINKYIQVLGKIVNKKLKSPFDDL